ncbi:MAG: hypothetical protein ACQESD_07470 [Thermoplasmatota archaeon]
MNWKRGSTVLLVALIVVNLCVAPVLSQDSHDDFDDADTDLRALLMSLNRTYELIYDSMNSTLRVNYTQNIGERIQQSYNLTEARDSYLLADDSKDTTAGARRIIKDMPDEVPSSLYLEELYLPFYHVSSNLTSFTRNHKGLILNLSETAESYNLYVDEGVDSRLLSGLRSLNDASRNLKKMEQRLPALKKGVEGLNRTYFDAAPLNKTLNEIGQLIPYYHDMIEELLTLFEKLSGYITIYVPSPVHPGENVDVEGYYSSNGSFLPNVTIVIEVGGGGTYQGQTDGSGYYNETIHIPWNASQPVTINVSDSENGNYSSNLTVDTDLYSTDIEIQIKKYYYFDEEITVHGNFSTDSPLDMDGFDLEAAEGRSFSPSEDGSFKLVYDSSSFRWGDGKIWVSYTGNESISSSHDEVEFEVSVPTNLSLQADHGDGYAEISEELSLYGHLLNSSSGEGIGGQRLWLSVDGDMDDPIETGGDGSYEKDIDLEISDLADGLHELRTVYNGTQVYRNSTSGFLYLFIMGDDYMVRDDLGELEEILGEDLSGDGVIGKVGGEGDDDGDDDGSDSGGEDDGEDEEKENIIEILRKNLILILIGILLLLLLIYHKYRSDQPEEPVEETTREEKPTLLKKEKRRAPTASNWKDIPSSYSALLSRLDSEDIVRITKGKTHREVYRDLKDRLGKDTHIQKVTDLFEKVYFAGEELAEKDVKNFNSAMDNLWGDLAV